MAPWWKEGIVYQIYPRSFADSNGDGVGDLPGITSKLDYLQELGVDGIWISPIYPSPMKDFGYDISDYTAIDPVFGTMAEFEELIRQAHARGIRVIMDMVMNHTSDQHPWFVEARSSKDNPRRDWFIWRPGGPGGRPPNNWHSIFGGSAWEYDEKSGEYYLHLFDPSQPDLNWRNPEVKAAMKAVWGFWLDKGVDGFRLDVAHLLVKHPEFPDKLTKFGMTPYSRQVQDGHCNLPETHDVWKEFRQLLDLYPGDRMAVAEPELDATGAEGFYGSGEDELHLAFNFSLFWRRWKAAAVQDAVLDWERRIPERGWPCWVLSNHDFGRHASRWAAGARTDARAKVAAALLLTVRGTPFMYYGEELAMRRAFIPRKEVMDPPGVRYWPLYLGRDGFRTPMQWTAAPTGGFTTGTPWMRLGPEAQRLNVELEAKDPGSVLNWYKRLIKLRRSLPALRLGTFRAWFGEPKAVFAYSRVHDGQTVSVLLNFSRFSRAVDLPAGAYEVLASTHRGEGASLGGTVKLHGDEALVLLHRG
ncbi:MAG TPA: alpha-glucosidase [Myxococcales bacterium]|nr:alpha-glucosidase [Myxococcales bacterium]